MLLQGTHVKLEDITKMKDNIWNEINQANAYQK